MASDDAAAPKAKAGAGVFVELSFFSGAGVEVADWPNANGFSFFSVVVDVVEPELADA